jgi:hypothetical protein
MQLAMMAGLAALGVLSQDSGSAIWDDHNRLVCRSETARTCSPEGCTSRPTNSMFGVDFRAGLLRYEKASGAQRIVHREDASELGYVTVFTSGGEAMTFHRERSGSGIAASGYTPFNEAAFLTWYRCEPL